MTGVIKLHVKHTLLANWCHFGPESLFHHIWGIIAKNVGISASLSISKCFTLSYWYQPQKFSTGHALIQNDLISLQFCFRQLCFLLNCNIYPYKSSVWLKKSFHQQIYHRYNILQQYQLRPQISSISGALLSESTVAA